MAAIWDLWYGIFTHAKIEILQTNIFLQKEWHQTNRANKTLEDLNLLDDDAWHAIFWLKWVKSENNMCLNSTELHHVYTRFPKQNNEDAFSTI